jgi:hypothetical protein
LGVEAVVVREEGVGDQLLQSGYGDGLRKRERWGLWGEVERKGRELGL